MVSTHFIFHLARKFLSALQEMSFYPYLDRVGRIDYQRGRKFEFQSFQKPTAGSLALSIFQYIYLDSSTEIRGTWHKNILKKELLSLHQASFYINDTDKVLQ